MIYERIVIARYIGRKMFGLQERASCPLCQHAVVDQFRASPRILADWGHEKLLGCTRRGDHENTDKTTLNQDKARVHGKYSSSSYDNVYVGKSGVNLGEETTDQRPRAKDINTDQSCPHFSQISLWTAIKRTSFLPTFFMR